MPKYATERPIYAQPKLQTRRIARTFKDIVGLVKQASLDCKHILDTAKASACPHLPLRAQNQRLLCIQLSFPDLLVLPPTYLCMRKVLVQDF